MSEKKIEKEIVETKSITVYKKDGKRCHPNCNYIFKEENFYNWDADHHALHTFYTDEIQINLLDYKYKDKNHHDDSIMWSGDGYNKYKEKFTSNLDG